MSMISLGLAPNSSWSVITLRTRKGYALCQCCCGKVKEVAHKYLRDGRSKSCGCLHWRGAEKNPAYGSWTSMRKRCLSPSDPYWHRYGARGIQVCSSWDDFWQFLADVGERPSKQHTLDRIDNDGNYEPGNVRWATRKEQANNRSTNRIICLNGQAMTLMQASEKLGIPFYAAWRRANRGEL